MQKQQLTVEMLFSDVTESGDRTHTSNCESNSEAILRLEAQVLAANIELNGVEGERTALQHQIELLISEIDQIKRTDKTQKCEIKKLINENDKLKREISRFSGMRKYAKNNVSTSSETQQSSSASNDKLMVPAEKYDSLRSNVISITDSLLAALDDDVPAEFRVVTHRRQRGNRSQSHNNPGDAKHNSSSAETGASQDLQVASYRIPTAHASSQQRHPRPSQQPSSRPSPQPIPVVEIGAAARAARSSTHAEPPAQNLVDPTKNNQHAATHRGTDTIIIGTSLVQGLGNRLHSLGIDATCYMYRGADIPTIQSRIPNILTPDVNPKRIILQVGGNDATKRSAESIAARYESHITLVGVAPKPQ